MPIDVERALGATLPPVETGWDQDRVILYHLGVGAGVPPTEPGELAYTYEGSLKVLPSFGTIPPFGSMMGVAGVEGMDVNLALLLHGEQDLELARPIPTSATAVHEGSIAAIYDKGKAAVAVVEVVTRDTRSGEVLFTNRSSLFLRGEGGWGGDPGPGPANEPPDRAHDLETVSPTLPQQALLYRLSGDKNPLHADPAFAAMGGFDRPILHGLCSYGIVCKAVVDRALGGDVAAVARYQARFAGVVFPGESIVTRMWDEGDRVVVAAHTLERETAVISNAAVWRR
jgi:acyl dehydratase